MDLVVPAGCITGRGGHEMRQALLRRGAVDDLVDGGRYYYIGWSAAPEEGHRTQAIEIPPADHWAEFEEALATWLPMWRWGDLTRLPVDSPWKWENIEPDLASLLLRTKLDIDALTTSTSPASAAHTYLTFIEAGLRYVIELTVGPGVAVRPYLTENTLTRIRERRSRRGMTDPLSELNLIEFQRIVRRSPAAAAVFGDGARLRWLGAVNEVRNKVFHPTRKQRVTNDDLLRLRHAFEVLEKAIARAEADQS